jgi:WD40 repeat protein
MALMPHKAVALLRGVEACPNPVSATTTYILLLPASGDDSGCLRVWDLRTFKEGGFVSQFNFHKESVTSVEWSPYESSMLATSGADNQVRATGRGDPGEGPHCLWHMLRSVLKAHVMSKVFLASVTTVCLA